MTKLTIEEFENFDIDAYFAKRQLRKDRSWVYDIIRVLWNVPNSGMRINLLRRELWAMREPSGLPMPSAFDKTVQSAINHHTSQSTRWNKKPESDLFYSPGKKGSGTWAVRRDKAAAWLRSHDLPEA